MDASPKECKMTALESNRILECKTFIMKLSMCPFKQKAVSEWARVGQLDKCRSIQELVPLCKRVWAKASTLYPCNTKHFPCQSSVGFSVGLFNFIFPETSSPRWNFSPTLGTFLHYGLDMLICSTIMWLIEQLPENLGDGILCISLFKETVFIDVQNPEELEMNIKEIPPREKKKHQRHFLILVFLFL